MGMAARKRLTVKGIETLPAPTKKGGKRDGRKFYMDASVSGFGVKVTETGSRSFVLIKRYPGFKHPAPRELGKVDAMTLEEAREKARAWNGLIAKGIDPAVAEEEAKLAAARRRETTVLSVFDEFANQKLATERQGRDVERDMRKEFVAALPRKAIADVTEEDVLRVVNAIKARGSLSQARNVLGYVRRFFDWAIHQRVYGLKANPCLQLRAARLIGEKKRRERVLTDDEIFAFWRATDRMPYPFGSVYRLLLLTGLRLNEAADAREGELDARQEIWTVPAVRMKGRDGKAREHVVPVTADIAAVLKSLPTFKSGDHLFSTTFGKSPAWVSDKVKKRLDARMLRTLRALARRRGENPRRVELPHWVNHDLRRTLRTGLSRLRVDRDVREAVLAHALPGVEGIYDRYSYLPEKRDALERWAAHVWEIVAPSASQNVVPFRAKA